MTDVVAIDEKYLLTTFLDRVNSVFVGVLTQAR